jgi:hypothetical protein
MKEFSFDDNSKETYVYSYDLIYTTPSGYVRHEHFLYEHSARAFIRDNKEKGYKNFNLSTFKSLNTIAGWECLKSEDIK